MQFELNDDVNFILEQLNNNGTGFLVGGAIRDLILGKIPEDYDFATNIDYNKLKIIFKDYNPHEIGAHFGIIMITVNGKNYEIAKFRKESGIYNSRYPKMIKFVSEIERDLARRDFTINALAYNKKRGFVDLYNGVDDIYKRQIRFVGNPKIRIEEDSLRIMRAFRLVARLGFYLELKTSEAIYNKRKFLNKISKERIFDELCKILMGDYTRRALNEMKRLAIINMIVPDFKYSFFLNNDNPNSRENIFKFTAKTIEYCSFDLITRLAGLFYQVGKIHSKTINANGKVSYDGYEYESIDIAQEQLKYFRASNEIISTVKKLIKYHNMPYKNSSDKDLKKMILELGNQNLDRLFDLIIANLKSQNYHIRDFNKKIVKKFFERVKILKEKSPIPTINDIEISGIDLINLKFDSKNIGEIKNEIYELILSEELENKKEKIIEYLMKKYKKERILEEEKSCGAVIYSQKMDKFLLVKMLNGNWGFAKGHIEANETEKEAAIREVKEETGLDIDINYSFRKSIKYIPRETTLKEVVFFIGTPKNETIKIDEKEIEDYEWCSYDKAQELITYKIQRDVLEAVKKYLNL